MGKKKNRRAIENLARGLSEGDLELFHAQFHEDSVMEYAQSGERIVGGHNRRAVYGAFPHLPKVSPKRILVQGDLGVLEARLDYGDSVDWQGAFIFEFRDGKAAKETSYWARPFEAPEWRSGWVDRSH